MICSECGAKNTKDASFCNKCGNNLKLELKEDNKSDIKAFLNNVLNHIKGIFIKPIDTAKSFIKDENYIIALIYLSVNVLLMSIFVLILCNSVYGLFTNYLGFGDLTGGFDSFYSPVEIPYFRIFLMSVMTGAITYGLIAGLTYLISFYIFKSETSFKKVLSWLGINSVLDTVLYIIVALCTLISIKLGVVAFLIAAILYMYNLFRSLTFATKTDENKLGYVLMVAIMITLLVVIVILPKIFW